MTKIKAMPAYESSTLNSSNLLVEKLSKCLSLFVFKMGHLLQ